VSAARGLRSEERAAFFDQGYALVEGALAPEDLAPVTAEIDEVVARVARELFAAGTIASAHEGEGFETRLARISEASNAAFRVLFNRMYLGPALFGLLRHEKILRLVEGLLGPEIMCHPGYRIRPKIPDIAAMKHITNVPWHQDSGYLAPECDGALLVTAWVPLTRATIDNGCLEVLPGAHRGGLLPHRNARGGAYLDVAPEALPAIAPRAVPARPGDVLLLSNLTPHRSTPNRTDRVRWSVDVRYHRDGESSGYPPEAGFLAASARRPGDVVRSAEAFERLRRSHLPGEAPRYVRWPIEDPADPGTRPEGEKPT
jgi:phytanoyl-CoA hydroxylase